MGYLHAGLGTGALVFVQNKTRGLSPSLIFDLNNNHEPTAPFEGYGTSGIGREGGDYALDFHADLKTLQIFENSVS